MLGFRINFRVRFLMRVLVPEVVQMLISALLIISKLDIWNREEAHNLDIGLFR